MEDSSALGLEDDDAASLSLEESDAASLGDGEFDSKMGRTEGEEVAVFDFDASGESLGEGVFEMVEEGVLESEMVEEGVLESELVEEGDAPMVRLAVTESETDPEADEEGVTETAMDSDGV